jgi:hypothetical protein
VPDVAVLVPFLPGGAEQGGAQQDGQFSPADGVGGGRGWMSRILALKIFRFLGESLSVDRVGG